MEAIIAVTPSETIKTKMIEDSKQAVPKYHGFAHGVRTMIAEEGWRGIYRGVGPVVRPLSSPLRRGNSGVAHARCSAREPTLLFDSLPILPLSSLSRAASRLVNSCLAG